MLSVLPHHPYMQMLPILFPLFLIRFIFTIISFPDIYWEVTSVILVVWGVHGDLEYKEAQMLGDLMRFVYGLLGGLPQQLLELYLISKLDRVTVLQIARICFALASELLSFVRTPLAYILSPNKKENPLAFFFRPEFQFERTATRKDYHLWAGFFFVFMLTLTAGQFVVICFMAGRTDG